MTRTHIEQALRGTRSFDEAMRYNLHACEQFFQVMQHLEPAGITLEYCWRFYWLGFQVGKED